MNGHTTKALRRFVREVAEANALEGRGRRALERDVRRAWLATPAPERRHLDAGRLLDMATARGRRRQ